MQVSLLYCMPIYVFQCLKSRKNSVRPVAKTVRRAPRCLHSSPQHAQGAHFYPFSIFLSVITTQRRPGTQGSGNITPTLLITSLRGCEVPYISWNRVKCIGFQIFLRVHWIYFIFFPFLSAITTQRRPGTWGTGNINTRPLITSLGRCEDPCISWNRDNCSGFQIFLRVHWIYLFFHFYQ